MKNTHTLHTHTHKKKKKKNSKKQAVPRALIFGIQALLK